MTGCVCGETACAARRRLTALAAAGLRWRTNVAVHTDCDDTGTDSGEAAATTIASWSSLVCSATATATASFDHFYPTYQKRRASAAASSAVNCRNSNSAAATAICCAGAVIGCRRI